MLPGSVTRCHALPPHSDGARRCHIHLARHGSSHFRASKRERRHRVRCHLRRYLRETGALALAACRQSAS